MNEPLHDLEAERAVLAAVMLDNDCFARLGELSPGDFHVPSHALLFDAMRAMRLRNELVDPITVANELRRRERLNTVGGVQYVQELTDSLPTLAHVEHYARIVAERAAQRRALEAVRRAGERLASGEPHPGVWQDLTRVMSGDGARGHGALRVGQDMEDLYDTTVRRARGEEKALATPWASFNALLGGDEAWDPEGEGDVNAKAGGLWPGMYVLVGSTGSGKSQWAVQVAVQAARAGEKVLYLALELSRRDLAARVTGVVAGVPWSRLLRGALSQGEIDGAFAKEHLVRALPLYTECGVPFGYGVDTMLSRAWALRPKVVVLDYLQLCGGRASDEPRVAVGRVSYAARMLARDLGAVVIVLSSTARANYAELVSDPDRDPTELVGLGKESGEIEYAADGVLVLARDARASERSRRVLVVAKNRYGEVGRVALDWSGTLFTEDPADAAHAGRNVHGAGATGRATAGAHRSGNGVGRDTEAGGGDDPDGVLI